MVAFETILNHFATWAAHPDGPRGRFWNHFVQFCKLGRPDGPSGRLRHHFSPNGGFRQHFKPFRQPGRPDDPNGRFGTILNHFAIWTAQTVQMVAFGIILDHFATWAAQTV